MESRTEKKCARCKNHGENFILKYHKRYCKFQNCNCDKCKKTELRQRTMAEQTASRRAKAVEAIQKHAPEAKKLMKNQLMNGKIEIFLIASSLQSYAQNLEINAALLRQTDPDNKIRNKLCLLDNSCKKFFALQREISELKAKIVYDNEQLKKLMEHSLPLDLCISNFSNNQLNPNQNQILSKSHVSNSSDKNLFSKNESATSIRLPQMESQKIHQSISSLIIGQILCFIFKKIFRTKS